MGGIDTMAEIPLPNDAETRAFLDQMTPATLAQLERDNQERLKWLREDADARRAGLEPAPWWMFWRKWRPAR
jgi:hypothetical protein